MISGSSQRTIMKFIIIALIAAAIGMLVALGGAQGGKLAGTYPIFIICGALAFLINWTAFVPALIKRTEKFYDLTGSITYLSMMGVAGILASPMDLRGKIVTAMVVIWALRLGSFLFMRIMRDGGDHRFDHIKTNGPRFFMAWTLQGLWALLTSACALAIIISARQVPLDIWAYAGLALWIIGFAFEIFADRQKKAFRADPKNKGRYITSGLWAWSRHPNYFGEITLWIGIAVMAVPVLTGWQWVCLISPVFVVFLLTKLSGIPTLTRAGQTRWGEEPGYQTYLKNTPLLIPRPPKG